MEFHLFTDLVRAGRLLLNHFQGIFHHGGATVGGGQQSLSKFDLWQAIVVSVNYSRVVKYVLAQVESFGAQFWTGLNACQGRWRIFSHVDNVICPNRL